MSSIYRRPFLAQQMARSLLRPGVLDEGLRSGLFLSGLRRTGKTTFLRHDLIPALEDLGAVVIYVDLWTDTEANPATLVHEALRQALRELQNPASRVLGRLRNVTGGDIDALGFRFGFKIEQVGAKGGPTLARALAEVVEQARTDVVLVIDEVQQAITSEDGNRMLLALKAARDAINPRPDTPGHFLFIGTGSHRALVNELTARRNQAFAGATSVAYPVLGPDYVAHLLERLRAEGATNLPGLDAATKAFVTLGHRPEELLRALRDLRQHLSDPDAADTVLPVLAASLRSRAADVEFLKLERLGTLAEAIFDRIAQSPGPARGLFSADAVADYGRRIGRPVRVEEIQPILNEMLAANVVMRLAHGQYGVTDPFVQDVWRERKAQDGDPPAVP